MAEKVFNLKFSSIEIVSKSLAEPKGIVMPENKKIDCRFDFLVDVRLAPAVKAALTVTDVTVVEATTNAPLAFFKTICVFEFPEQFDEYFTKVEVETIKYDMPMELEIILKSAGLSTTRGIIFSELRGTYLHGAVLPLVDIATLVKNEHKKRKGENDKQDNPI